MPEPLDVIHCTITKQMNKRIKKAQMLTSIKNRSEFMRLLIAEALHARGIK